MFNGEIEHPGVKIIEERSQLKNGETLFGKESLQNAPFKEPRLIKRAKRILSEPTEKIDVALKTRVPFSKNSKKSRSGRRGLAKKGGAGGKGVWGFSGIEIAEEIALDECDPNYDSDSAMEGVRLVSVSPPFLNDDEKIENCVTNCLKEYFENADVDDAIDCLTDLNIAKDKLYKIVVLVISIAIDRHNPQREMASRLISDLSISLLSQSDIGCAFNELLQIIPELQIDVPDAANMLGCFIARAIADDCIPPAFTMTYKGQVESKEATIALSKTEVLLNMKHGIVRLDNVWGVGGGTRPVKALKKRIALLLREYLSSGDCIEATRCLKELDVPHFHHEFVYDSIILSIEKSTDRDAQMICDLLKSLFDANIITEDEMEKGIKQVFDDMSEICIDVPAAYVLLEHVSIKMKAVGIMSEKLYQEIPNRGRKRFVSEGDGGLVKL